jgi:GntR family transcriptional regulator, rspAB operon transcriptional repressor
MIAQSPWRVRVAPRGDAMSKPLNRRPRKSVEGVGSPLPPSAAIDPRRSLSAQIYELAREAIVSLWLKPGQAVSEKEIASQLGVSRTPVREALMRLADEGLIEVFRQSGTFVSPIKLRDVYEGLLIREALETAVVRQATGRFDRQFERRFQALLARQRGCARRNDYDGFHALDEEFHRTISECSGTPRVWRIIISAKAQLDRVRRLGIRAPGQFRQILQQHESIVAGMKSGDEALAASALQEHLNAVFTSIRLLLDENSAYFLSEEPESSDKGPRISWRGAGDRRVR